MSSPQELKKPRPLSARETLFLAGLAAYTLGQILLNLGPDFVNRQQPVDYAHWLLIIGVLMLLPFAMNLPRSPVNLAAAPILVAGVGAVIGMCVLDFIFWSLPSGELESALAAHLIGTSVIWEPFMRFGPNTVFMLGLLLPSFWYFRTSRLGVALVFVGWAVIYFAPLWSNPPGYIILAIGYWLNFRSKAA